MKTYNTIETIDQERSTLMRCVSRMHMTPATGTIGLHTRPSMQYQ
jgi:hypothetical protein